MTIQDLLPGLRPAGPRELCGPCPWCGTGRDRLRVWPEEGSGGRYWCRRCGTSGDAITVLREREGLSYRDACRRLEIEPAAPRPAVPTYRDEDPSPTWRAAAGAVVDEAARLIWTPRGAAALRHLRGRGITDETVRRWRLGAWPEDEWRDGLWVPAGVVIPWHIGGQLWQLKVRTLAGATRYLAVTWADLGRRETEDAGQAHLFGGDSIRDGAAVIFTEGELDAAMLSQEAGDLAAVVTLGGTSGDLTARAARLLLRARRRILALDADDAGQAAARRLQQRWPRLDLEIAPPWPHGKDPCQSRAAGVDLRRFTREVILRGR